MRNSNKMVACTFCRIKGLKTHQLRMCIEEMEEGEGASNHDKDSKARIPELVMQRQIPMDAREKESRKH
jgi:hypothetical protein